jgi:hypothetical protein
MNTDQSLKERIDLALVAVRNRQEQAQGEVAALNFRAEFEGWSERKRSRQVEKLYDRAGEDSYAIMRTYGLKTPEGT